MDSQQKDVNEVCVGPESETAGKASSCEGCPNQKVCASGDAKKDKERVTSEVEDRMSDIKHKILVLSGKGGVGKSSVSSQLAWALSEMGFQVGILDIDICGPSVPCMTGVQGEEVKQSPFGWLPVSASDNLAVMSIAFMLPNQSDPVVWRGPRKNGLITEFLTKVYWGNLDFLIIDAPPGTSDEHITIAQTLKTHPDTDGAVIVTTPQEVALLAVRKGINFCKKVKVPIIGVVENMSIFRCPCCPAETDIYKSSVGRVKAMATDMKIPFLGAIPLDPDLLDACDTGRSYFTLTSERALTAWKPFQNVIRNILQSTPALRETALTAKTQLPLAPSPSTSSPLSTASTSSTSTSSTTSGPVQTNGSSSSQMELDTRDQETSNGEVGAGVGGGELSQSLKRLKTSAS